jgi:hypothetical protein
LHQSQLISSQWTVIYKFILPTVWISGFGLGTLALFSSAFDVGTVTPPYEVEWIFLGLWVLGTALFYRYCIPLKRVSIDGGELIVSNYAKEVRVPLSGIRRVSEGRFQSPRTIRVVFDADSGLGTTIMFMPPMGFVWPWQEHPVATQLRKLSQTA